MKLSKRIVALFLAAVMAIGLMPGNVIAAGDYDYTPFPAPKATLIPGNDYAFFASEADYSGVITFEFIPTESGCYTLTQTAFSTLADIVEFVDTGVIHLLNGGKWLYENDATAYVWLEAGHRYLAVIRELGGQDGSIRWEYRPELSKAVSIRHANADEIKVWENIDGMFAENNAGEEFFYYFVSDFMEFEVTFADGTTQILENGDKLYGNYVDDGVYNSQYASPWKPGENVMSVNFSGLTCEAYVTVVTPEELTLESTYKFTSADTNSDGKIYFNYTCGESGEYKIVPTGSGYYWNICDVTDPNSPYRVYVSAGEADEARVFSLEQGRNYRVEISDRGDIDGSFLFGVASELTGMNLISEPYITSFVRGIYPVWVMDGAVVEMVYADGITEKVDIYDDSTEYRGKNFDFVPPADGETEAEITWGDFEVSYDLNINEKTITSIDFNSDISFYARNGEVCTDTNGEKYVLYNDEMLASALFYAGITVAFDDGTTGSYYISDYEYKIDFFSHDQETEHWTVDGENELTIGFGGKAFTVNVEIIPRATGLTLKKLPIHTTLFAGEISAEAMFGAELEVSYTDGVIEGKKAVSINSASDKMLWGEYFWFLPPYEGENTAGIDYSGYTVNYPVTSGNM